eukprot:1596926-Rhodomonas_salina.1
MSRFALQRQDSKKANLDVGSLTEIKQGQIRPFFLTLLRGSNWREREGRKRKPREGEGGRDTIACPLLRQRRRRHTPIQYQVSQNIAAYADSGLSLRVHTQTQDCLCDVSTGDRVAAYADSGLFVRCQYRASRSTRVAPRKAAPSGVSA